MKHQARRARRVTMPVLMLLLVAVPVLIYSHARATPMQRSAPVETRAVVDEILELNPNVALFTQALKQSALWKALQSTPDFTLFAPLDESLRNDGSAFLLEVVLLKQENQQRLDELMAQHVIPAFSLIHPESDPSITLPNALGGCITLLQANGNVIQVGPDAMVSGQQILGNGQIVFIDRLLWQGQDDNDPCHL